MSVMDRVLQEGRDELTRDEMRTYAEEQTAKYFGMTVEEFLQAAEDGSVPDSPHAVHVALLTGARLKSC